MVHMRNGELGWQSFLPHARRLRSEDESIEKYIQNEMRRDIFAVAAASCSTSNRNIGDGAVLRFFF